MNYTYNFVSLIDTLGVIQGLLFGGMLIFLNTKKNKPTLFLGLFILLFSLEPIPNILQDLHILNQYPRLELFPVNFHFLAFPFFYIYIQKISIFKYIKPSYWTLIPGGIEFLATLIIFFLPVATKLSIKSSSFTIIYFVVGLLYSIYIGLLTLRWIIAHKAEVAQQYSEINSKNLHWPLLFIGASIIFQILLLTTLFIENNQWYTFISIVNIILIYWVSFKGITQNEVTALVWIEKQPNNTKIPFSPKPLKLAQEKPINVTTAQKRHFMSSEDIEEVIETVKDYIENSNCFAQENLTIIDVAEAVNIHPKRISHSLNSKLNTNFNSYINTYRIKKAKLLLKSDSTKNLSVEGIGFEVGFHSKTSFYTAFKKIENTTPAKYKNS